jgi:hypothetical protein
MRPIVTNLDGTHSVSCTATDGQTNTRVGPGSTEMPLAFKVDETPATITCPSPAPTFVLHQSGATVSAALADLTPGPGSLSPASPQAAATPSVGAKSGSYSGTDIAGNASGPVACAYKVVYQFLGFFSTLAKSSWRAGATIPVKFALADVNGVRIPDAEVAGDRQQLRRQAHLRGPDTLTQLLRLRRDRGHPPVQPDDREDAEGELYDHGHDHEGGRRPQHEVGHDHDPAPLRLSGAAVGSSAQLATASPPWSSAATPLSSPARRTGPQSCPRRTPLFAAARPPAARTPRTCHG